MQRKNLLIALLFSFLFHSAIFLMFLLFKKEIQIFYPPASNSSKSSHITYVKLSKPTISNHFTPQNQPIATKQPAQTITQTTPIPISKIQQTTPITLPKEAIVAPIPLAEPKKEEKHAPTNKSTESSKPTAIQPKKEENSPTSLNNFLLTKEKTTEPDEATKSYLKLYGEEFYTFEPKVQQFLITNLGKIGQITQRYLKYPTLSIQTKQQGVNTVEFILHPNGDITNLKLISSSTYSALDQNSIRTIQIAYKDYPKPSTPTKIKIYINYIYGSLY